jgi:hypothetical protein
MIVVGRFFVRSVIVRCAFVTIVSPATCRVIAFWTTFGPITIALYLLFLLISGGCFTLNPPSFDSIVKSVSLSLIITT